MENLSVQSFNGFSRASVLPVGSKSITNRALVLSAMRVKDEDIILKGALFSRDTEIMMDCLQKLGFQISADKDAKTISIKRGSAQPKSANLFLGNAGTAARFLTAFVSRFEDGEFFFDSDKAMYVRPMKGLIDALKALGAEFEFLGEENHFPFKMRPNGWKSDIEVEVDASASSQILSALLMAMSGGQKVVLNSKHTPSEPFIEMTRQMISQSFSSSYDIEPDATAASYFAMLPVITGGVCEIKNFAKCVLQGDAKFVDILESAGLISTMCAGDNLLVCASEEFSNDDLVLDFNDISDTFLTLASASVFLPCKVKITGIAHTRKQETDRVSAMASQLKKLCANVVEAEDSLEIVSFPAEEKCSSRVEILKVLSEKLPQKILIETFEDHRIAMSFGVLGCANIGRDFIEIQDPNCVSKTWREFFEVLANVRVSSHKFRVIAVDGGAAVGKSSVSKEASKRLGYMHVDTGAHYRALAYVLLENGVSTDDVDGVKKLLQNLTLSTAIIGNTTKIQCSGKILDDSDIRNERINSVVSIFASIPEVRDFLKNYQRSMADFAKLNGFCGMIMEGRDIGSIIFPDANVRIFLDADEETRAARRAKEGISDSISKRDALDKNRKVAPLVCPEGASLIDTSKMTKAEVVAKAISFIVNS